MKIELKTRLSADSAAGEHDVRQLKKALNILGYYTPYEQIGITGTPDARLFSALKKFQKDSNLPASGIIKPDAPTLNTLKDALTDTPQGYYIWRTAGDERVRPEHAQYNGTKRAWSDSPDPGEDFNCRCWAEPITHKNCEKEAALYREIQERIKTLSNRLNDQLLNLNMLIEENNKLIKDTMLVLGTQVVGHLLNTPIERIGLLAEILQKYFGNIISDEAFKAASNFMLQASAIRKKAQHTRDQIRIIIIQLEDTAKERKDAEVRLEACKNDKK